MRISHQAQQRAWLAGNALHTLDRFADAVRGPAGTLVPYDCELAPALVPFNGSSLLSGTPVPSPQARKARRRQDVHLRAWFRTREEVDWKRFGEVVRQIALRGRLGVTKSSGGRKTCFTFTVEQARRKAVETALKGFLAGLELVETKSPFGCLKRLIEKGYALEVAQFFPTAPYWRAFAAGNEEKTPPIQSESAAIGQIRQGIAFIEAIFERAPEGWAPSCLAAQAAEQRAIQQGHVGSWGFEGIEANKEIVPNSPLYFAVLRCGACVPPPQAKEAVEIVSQPYRSIMHGGKALAVLDTAQHLAVLGSPERIAQMLEQGHVHTSGSLMTEGEVARFSRS